ncbi:MAG: 3-oxoacyl-ACP synthase, partial [Acidobacteriota bacterium]|nr:3-oxoacyl-ACP synthase [Acidobacteriota bacterium]
VVNGEFHAYERGIPSALPIRSPDQLRYTFPTFTIGEMATASVLVPSDHKWRFAFRSEPSKAGACTIPLPGYTDFAEPDERLGLNGINQLVSFGEELSAFALQRMLDFVPTCVANPLAVDLWVPHAASATLCKIAESKLSLHGRLFGDVFPEYGNVVSASIPTGIAMALNSNRLKRGDRLILCPASAGMSFALVDCVY